MSSILSREEQLNGLRARREKELAQEKEIVAFAIENKIMPPGTEYLFDGPGQFPGWHGGIHEFLKSLAAIENHSMFKGFIITGGELITSPSGSGIPAAEFELLVQSTEKARKECCVCGAPRGRQTMSVKRMCDVCVFVDIALSRDAEAAAARGWHQAIGRKA